MGRKLGTSDVISQYLISSTITDTNTTIQYLIYLLFFRNVNSTKPASKVREERKRQDSSKDTGGKGPGMGPGTGVVQNLYHHSTSPIASLFFEDRLVFAAFPNIC